MLSVLKQKAVICFVFYNLCWDLCNALIKHTISVFSLGLIEVLSWVGDHMIVAAVVVDILRSVL